jgi:hypothetical protein
MRLAYTQTPKNDFRCGVSQCEILKVIDSVAQSGHGFLGHMAV